MYDRIKVTELPTQSHRQYFMEAKETQARRLTLAKAIGVRLLYSLHCLLAISRVSTILNEPNFWIYSLSILLLIFEGLHAVIWRKGLEHKWMSLGTFLFICLDIGPIWIMELDKANKRTSATSPETSAGGTGNNTSTTTTPQLQNIVNSNFIQLDDDVFVYAIEQSFLLFMIIGRWTLPKGRMSRDKLSNLLLVLIGKACDMTDFFTLFSHKNVAEDRSFTIVVLLVWSISVFQFPISFTESRDNDVVISIHRNKQYMQVVVKTLNVCLKTEIWSILASIFMQEFPFLVCRSYAVGALGIVDDTIIFFLFKNSLIIAMYLYRLISLCLETDPYSDLATAVVEAESDGNNSVIVHGTGGKEDTVTFDLKANGEPVSPEGNTLTDKEMPESNDNHTTNLKTGNPRKSKVCPDNI